MLPRKCTIFICIALTGFWVFCLVYARSLCTAAVVLLLGSDAVGRCLRRLSDKKQGLDLAVAGLQLWPEVLPPWNGNVSSAAPISILPPGEEKKEGDTATPSQTPQDRGVPPSHHGITRSNAAATITISIIPLLQIPALNLLLSRPCGHFSSNLHAPRSTLTPPRPYVDLLRHVLYDARPTALVKRVAVQRRRLSHHCQFIMACRSFHGRAPQDHHDGHRSGRRRKDHGNHTQMESESSASVQSLQQSPAVAKPDNNHHKTTMAPTQQTPTAAFW